MRFSLRKVLENKEEWNKVDPLDINKQVDAADSQKSWLLLKAKHDQQRRRKFLRVRYAAVLALLLMAIAAVYKVNDIQKGKNIVVAAESGMIQYILPDSSTIWLKSGSSVTYQRDFNEDNRNIALNGIAFFEVTKNKGLPFIISSDKSTVKVLGTSFLYDATLFNLLQVHTGVVQFGSKKGGFKILEKGEGMHLTEANKFVERPFDQNSISWKTQRMVFKGASLNEVVRVVSKHYDSNLTYENNEEVELNATFDHNTLEEIIDFITIATGVEITIVNEPVTTKQ